MKSTKRKIHIDLTEEIHKKLRVKTALQDLSIQRFVEDLISAAVVDVKVGRFHDVEIRSESCQGKEESQG
jgi:hypothetical protein